ncbi:acyltransferase family protein, partial [Hansschlegelia beijingensis]|uniref:acyltransferase family protein n=1 Tax=Hansschlegelia beijingensis TaxID=1133344 RepID=UPI00387EEB90
MTYRPEIDGLRAVAVLAVLLFHATGMLPGGFAGVDVFFVISGYVITSMLATELDAGRFSLVRFYERRVRRLFPALAVTILVTAAASAMILLPLDLKAMGKSAVAAALMVSNVLFWDEAGYFDAAAQTKPLLHTWSLAIEEQFYLVYPLLLAGLWKFGRRGLLWTLALLFGLSLAAAVWMAPGQPLTAFYLAPFRLWELMLGGLIALRPVRRLEGDVFAGLGVAMIAVSFFIFNAESDFPGWPALLPTVGTALVLNGARAGTAVARALAAPPAVFVGKISYSLYLVHWPLIVLLEYRDNARLGLMGGLAVIGVSLLLAWLSWRFVEQPFRQHAPGRPLRVFSRAAAATA